MKFSLRRHPLLVYFAMAFAISWGGITCAAATIGFSLDTQQPLATGLFFVAMLLGPCVSGLMLTALMEGRAGLRKLGSRLVRWRAGIGWYAIVLLTAPLLLLSVLWSFSALASPNYTPQSHWALLAVGLFAGAFEEIGWTGFATPLLLARGDSWSAGLRLGLIWDMWHALVVFLFTFAAIGQGWIISFIVVYIATLTPYRILMTSVYAHTNSVFLAALMHASYTGWLLVLFPATSPAQSLIWQSAFAAALWTAALIVHRRARRRPIGRRMNLAGVRSVVHWSTSDGRREVRASSPRERRPHDRR